MRRPREGGRAVGLRRIDPVPLGEQGADGVPVAALGGLGEPRIARGRPFGVLRGGGATVGGRSAAGPAARETEADETATATITPSADAGAQGRMSMESRECYCTLGASASRGSRGASREGIPR